MVKLIDNICWHNVCTKYNTICVYYTRLSQSIYNVANINGVIGLEISNGLSIDYSFELSILCK